MLEASLRALGAPGYAPSGDARAAYETHGIGLTRHLARRLAKTRLLLPMREFLDRGEAGTADALAVFGLYAAAAMTSWGRGYRQPSFDPAGTVADERDPETGARLTARLVTRGGPIRLVGRIEVDGLGTVTVDEEISGTTVGIHGLGMPAPSRLVFERGGPRGAFEAQASGMIITELAPRPFGWIVRGHGALQLSSSDGDAGRVRLDRDGWIDVEVRAADGRSTAARSAAVRWRVF